MLLCKTVQTADGGHANVGHANLGYEGYTLYRLGPLYVRRPLRSCGRGCGWHCLKTAPSVAAFWTRRQVHMASSFALLIDWPSASYDADIHLRRHQQNLAAMQALEEELSLAAGSQRSMRSNSFTSADGMSTRSQGSMARQASSNPTQIIGTPLQSFSCIPPHSYAEPSVPPLTESPLERWPTQSIAL